MSRMNEKNIVENSGKPSTSSLSEIQLWQFLCQYFRTSIITLQ
jgi:hypothetical protein